MLRTGWKILRWIDLHFVISKRAQRAAVYERALGIESARAEYYGIDLSIGDVLPEYRIGKPIVDGVAYQMGTIDKANQTLIVFDVIYTAKIDSWRSQYGYHPRRESDLWLPTSEKGRAMQRAMFRANLRSESIE